jgi:flagellar FliJ protein
MKKFTFRLDALLDLRKQQEEQVRLRLAAKNREIIGKNQEIGALHEALKALQSSEKVRRTENAPVLIYRYGIVYRHKLKADILMAGRQIDDLRAEAEKIRQEIVGATKKRRALELVRDRRFAEWKRAYQQEQQQFIDEVAGRRHAVGV